MSIVPHAVFQELEVGTVKDQTAKLLCATPGVEIRSQPIAIPAWLSSLLQPAPPRNTPDAVAGKARSYGSIPLEVKFLDSL